MDLSTSAWAFREKVTTARPAASNYKHATATSAISNWFYLCTTSDTSRKSYRFCRAFARHERAQRLDVQVLISRRTVHAYSSPKLIVADFLHRSVEPKTTINEQRASSEKSLISAKKPRHVSNVALSMVKSAKQDHRHSRSRTTSSRRSTTQHERTNSRIFPLRSRHSMHHSISRRRPIPMSKST